MTGCSFCLWALRKERLCPPYEAGGVERSLIAKRGVSKDGRKAATRGHPSRRAYRRRKSVADMRSSGRGPEDARPRAAIGISSQNFAICAQLAPRLHAKLQQIAIRIEPGGCRCFTYS